MLLKKIKQHLKKVKANYTGFSVRKPVLFAQENKTSIFHKLLPDLQNNPEEFLNQRCLDDLTLSVETLN